MQPFTRTGSEWFYGVASFPIGIGTGQHGDGEAGTCPEGPGATDAPRRRVPVRGSDVCAQAWVDGCADTVPMPSLGLVALLADVRAAVTTYVGRRRDEGALLERVLPDVKVLVRAAASSAETREVTELLVAQAVRWSISAYDAPSEALYDPWHAAPNAQS